MGKAVLFSIKPIWCEKIASGKKTVEIRKTKPKLDAPFKCFIYETQGITDTPWVDEDGHLIFKGRGAVIGEFVCDKVYSDIICGERTDANILFLTTDSAHCMKAACLTERELSDYCNAKPVYGWHISDLKIYDKPKPLGAFNLKRPPQSWCYVE